MKKIVSFVGALGIASTVAHADEVKKTDSRSDAEILTEKVISDVTAGVVETLVDTFGINLAFLKIPEISSGAQGVGPDN